MKSSDDLRKAINAAPWTLAELSRRSGVAYTTLHSFVRGATGSLRAEAFNAVVDALRVLNRRSVRETGADFEGPTVKVPVAIPEWLARFSVEHGLDVEALLAQGGIEALRAEADKTFRDHYRESIAETRAYVDRYGTLSQQFGMI